MGPLEGPCVRQGAGREKRALHVPLLGSVGGVAGAKAGLVNSKQKERGCGKLRRGLM